MFVPGGSRVAREALGFVTRRPRSYPFDHAKALFAAFTSHGMHELSIMESALQAALSHTRQAGAARLHVLRLRIGDLSGVVPEALQFAFEALAQGTEAEGGRLDIERVQARFWCGACQAEFGADNLLAVCPTCSQPSGDLRAGRELEIASLEIE